MLDTQNTAVVVPWHRRAQLDEFLTAWGILENHPGLVLSQDQKRSGCAVTKNRGIMTAYQQEYEAAVVLDDDCFPDESEAYSSLEEFVALHVSKLQGPAPVEMSLAVTDPPSRGTPYKSRTLDMPVAAVMGFWTEVGDYDACSQLVHGATHPMQFDTRPVFGRYFPLCGMNLSFRLSEWPWCRFVDVSRFDDIWQGWMWQKHASEQGQCFRLDGPKVRHSRQSNVWANLRDEALHLETNDILWHTIATLPAGLEYRALRAAIAQKHPQLAPMFADPLVK